MNLTMGSLPTGCNRLRSESVRQTLGLLLVFALTPAGAIGADLDGFAQPHQEIRVAAPETGLIARVAVVEGQSVRAGDVLAELDNRLLRAALAVADARREAVGAIDAATADHDRKVRRLGKLRELLAAGSAREEEVVRAETEALVAAATLQSAREDRKIATLEHARIQSRMEYRTLRSPIDGVVTEIFLQEGEFVTSLEPWVLRISRIDRLQIEAHVPVSLIGGLDTGRLLTVEFPQSNASRPGEVEYVAPIVDPKSGTVVVKLAVDNSAGEIRAGQRALIRLAP